MQGIAPSREYTCVTRTIVRGFQVEVAGEG